MSTQPDIAYWVGLTQFRGFGGVRLGRLSRRFTDMERAFNASALELMEAGIEPKIANRFLQERIHIDPQDTLRELEVQGVQPVTLRDEIYPPLLKEIYDPPGVLFVRGTLPDPERKHIAVVGSRKATNYGERVTNEIVSKLAKVGTVIVSGLAYGIDATAHAATVKAEGTTIAVLGTGVDEKSIYPSRHRTLASRILASGGAIVSEFPLGTPPLKHHFPFRNRVIAGMCHGTLVVEAAIKSGSLITARSALDSGRDVYAVPGSIHAPLCEGPNNLIKLGATPTTSAQDILGLDVDLDPNKPLYRPGSAEEEAIYGKLSHEPIHLDELIRATELTAHKTSSTLTLMEMKGAARHHGGKYYTR